MHGPAAVTQIVSYLQRHRDAMATDLREIASLESPTHNKEAVDMLGSHVAKLFRDAGATIMAHPRETVGDIIEVRYGSGNEQLLILCHLDTVFDVGDQNRNRIRVEGDRLYGPGVYDMKAGVVQFLWVLRALKHLALSVPYEVVGLLTTDEEVGSLQSRELIEQFAQHSRAAFVLEPAATAQGCLVTRRKGIGRYTLKITGKPSHSGAAFDQGVSAIVEAANQIHRLTDIMDLDLGTTINPGIIHGGTRANIVAEHATVTLDTRFSTPEEGQRLHTALYNLAPILPGAHIQVTGGITRPPLVDDLGVQHLYTLAIQVGRSIGLSLGEYASGGGSDANFTAAIGCPTLDGLGAVGSGLHTFDEYVDINSMPERAALLAGLLLSV